MNNTIENSNITETAGNMVKIAKYPAQYIESILKYINETDWNKMAVIDIFAFINDVRQILANVYEVTEEELKERQGEENPGVPYVEGEIVE